MLISDVLVDLLLMVPHCPEPVAERALRNSMRRFCRATYALRATSDDIEIGPGDDSLDLLEACPTGTEPVALLEIALDGRALTATTAYLDPLFPISAGTPSSYWSESEHKVRLWPAAEHSHKARVVVALSTRETSDIVPDLLGNRWRDGILGGAQQTLCLHPGQPYTDRELAAIGAAQYLAAVGTARIEGNRLLGRELRVAARRFA